MEGNNELHFNNATMNIILEYYLNTQLFGANIGAVTVLSVEELKSSCDHGFRVVFQKPIKADEEGGAA